MDQKNPQEKSEQKVFIYKPKFTYRWIPYKDYCEISKFLLEYYEIFYRFWTVGYPEFSTRVDTCAVFFEKKTGKYIKFVFNPDFWDTLDNYERAYIIAHECLHLILNHGKRALESEDHQRANVALDIVVNNILSNGLGLKKTETLLQGQHMETVFKDQDKVLKNRSFEYYYNYIKENPDNINQERLVNAPSHLYLGESDLKALLEAITGQEIDDETMEKIKDETKEPGTESLDNIYDLLNNVTHKQPRWKNFIKKVIKTKKGIIEREFCQSNWYKLDKRTSLLPKNIIIPNNNFEKPEFKYPMWFFQDISGSCEGYIQEFFQVAKSIPEKIFDVRFHTFDTVVREVPLSTKTIHGGGGTCFAIIEAYIQKKIKEEQSKYPELIVCITDGYGTQVKPAHPRNWHWILTEDNKSCIDQNCNFLLYNQL